MPPNFSRMRAFWWLFGPRNCEACRKYNPLNQWLHLDCFEVLPDEPVTDAKPEGSRYDDHIVLFGKQLQEKIMSQKTFMVGRTLGCEILKNFALWGGMWNRRANHNHRQRPCRGPNLSRQFLFREHNVGKPKSVGASDAVKLMNPICKCAALSYSLLRRQNYLRR